MIYPKVPSHIMTQVKKKNKDVQLFQVCQFILLCNNTKISTHLFDYNAQISHNFQLVIIC